MSQEEHAKEQHMASGPLMHSSVPGSVETGRSAEHWQSSCSGREDRMKRISVSACPGAGPAKTPAENTGWIHLSSQPSSRQTCKGSKKSGVG